MIPLYRIDMNENGTAKISKFVKEIQAFHYQYEVIADNISLERIHYLIEQLQQNTFELEGHKRAIGEN